LGQYCRAIALLREREAMSLEQRPLPREVKVENGEPLRLAV
jgi:hypothetical protein